MITWTYAGRTESVDTGTAVARFRALMVWWLGATSDPHARAFSEAHRDEAFGGPPYLDEGWLWELAHGARLSPYSPLSAAAEASILQGEATPELLRAMGIASIDGPAYKAAFERNPTSITVTGRVRVVGSVEAFARRRPVVVGVGAGLLGWWVYRAMR